MTTTCNPGQRQDPPTMQCQPRWGAISMNDRGILSICLPHTRSNTKRHKSSNMYTWSNVKTKYNAFCYVWFSENVSKAVSTYVKRKYAVCAQYFHCIVTVVLYSTCECHLWNYKMKCWEQTKKNIIVHWRCPPTAKPDRMYALHSPISWPLAQQLLLSSLHYPDCTVPLPASCAAVRPSLCPCGRVLVH